MCPFYASSNVHNPDASFIKQLFRSQDLVFDIGAHVGKRAELYLAHGAHVVCIEPQIVCCNILRKKFGNNSHVSIEQVGLAKQPGQLTLAICSSSNAISTFSQEWQEKSRHKERGYEWDKTISVPVATLDHMIAKYGTPQFCKIDVENFEYEVLLGLSKPIPCLSIEFHVEFLYNAKKCLERLENLGYKKFNFVAGEKSVFILEEWVGKDNLVQQLLHYSRIYLRQENDPLWGDIYAKYSE